MLIGQVLTDRFNASARQRSLTVRHASGVAVLQSSSHRKVYWRWVQTNYFALRTPQYDKGYGLARDRVARVFTGIFKQRELFCALLFDKFFDAVTFIETFAKILLLKTVRFH